MSDTASTREFNFDGLVGPTHNYAGLSHGNMASAKHHGQTANPRAAVLEGLAKMRQLSDWGFAQAVLPPLSRPNIGLLFQLGFRGTPAEMIASAARVDPVLLAVAYSASAMWTANAATVAPSCDTEDHRVHFTPANLSSLLHRSIEASETTAHLRTIFANPQHFVVHDPLPAGAALSDEGAANHTRLCADYGGSGIQIFAYGRTALNSHLPHPQRFPARQTRESCAAIIRRHQLSSRHAWLWQQNPLAIDAGVFHNDVISVGNQNVFLCHELAFVEQSQRLDELRRGFAETCQGDLHLFEVSATELPIGDAVQSYLFNSQLLSREDGNMTLVCPRECQETPSAQAVIQRLLESSNPVDQVQYFDLRQSMRNGGGPACLRLRVVLNPAEQQAFHQGVRFTPGLHDQLQQWAQQHYRETLTIDDLRDPNLMHESWSALEELERILQMPVGSICQAS